jgi:hypothetical protein
VAPPSLEKLRQKKIRCGEAFKVNYECMQCVIQRTLFASKLKKFSQFLLLRFATKPLPFSLLPKHFSLHFMSS